MDEKSELGVMPADASTMNAADVSPDYIGLSEGKFAFNIPGKDHEVRCQASQELNQGHIANAETDWHKALQIQPNDAEVLIYQENQRIVEKKLPYISIIVGVTVTGTTISNGLDVLQGTYVAQKRYNQDHENATQLRIIIANFGGTQQDAMSAANQIVTVAKKDGRIKALVNLPVRVDTPEVINILSRGGFPIVLASGSTNSQQDAKNTFHNVFHIEAPTTEQGERAAQYVENNCPNKGETRKFDCEGSDIAVFVANDDSYSRTMGEAFIQQLSADKADKVVHPHLYISADPKSIENEVDGLEASIGLIYFSGDAGDARILINRLLKTGKHANIRVLGGDALYQTGQYATSGYSHLNFTAFAYPDEWSILQPSSLQSDPQEFLCDYAQDFAGGKDISFVCNGSQSSLDGQEGIYGYTRPESDVMLSRDALWLVLDKLATLGGTPSRDQLLQSIRGIDEADPFEGVSGRIAFGPDGNPIDKAILVLRVNEKGETRQEQNYGTF